MKVELTKLSSKGQVVIPQDIREDMHLEEGTPFAVVQQNDAIILKKMKLPEIKSWEEVSRPFKEAAKKAGLFEEDVERIIVEVRKAKQKR